MNIPELIRLRLNWRGEPVQLELEGLYEDAPAHVAALIRYAADRVPTRGVFLQSVLANDFHLALAHCRSADFPVPLLPLLDKYVRNHLPEESHGSRDAVAAWLTCGEQSLAAERAAVEVELFPNAAERPAWAQR